jgi:hypothetical protein
VPGSYISIVSVDELLGLQRDELLVLPWNLASEVKAQLSSRTQIPVKVVFPL